MEQSKKINLKKDIEYKICTCGTSKILPYCDDSHRELNKQTSSNFKSLKLIPEEDITLEVSCKNWEDEE